MPAENFSVSSWTPAGRAAQREYTTSSGSKCLIRDLELEDVVELGLIDQMDSLTAIVQTDHLDRVQKGKKPEDRKSKQPTKAQAAADEERQLREMLRNKDSFEKIKEVVDKVVSQCVVEPKLYDPWIDDPNAVTADNPRGRRKLDADERDPERAYLDYVNFVDKMGIFQEVFGGMESLQQFREAADQSVGTLENVAESERPTRRPTGRAKVNP
jgi:hypothetical protein